MRDLAGLAAGARRSGRRVHAEPDPERHGLATLCLGGGGSVAMAFGRA